MIRENVNSIVTVGIWCSGIVFGICIGINWFAGAMLCGAVSLGMAALTGVFR